MSWLARTFLALLCLFLLMEGLAEADWVEIPQFSDNRKIYRQPIVMSSHGQRYRQQQLDSQRRIFTMTATTAQPNYYAHDASFHKVTQDMSSRNISAFSGSNRPNFPENEPTLIGTIATLTTESVISSIVEENEEDTEVEVDESIEVESSEEENKPQFVELPVIDDSKEATTLEPAETTTAPLSTESSKTSQCQNETDDDKGFFDYLPVDLLKRVHKTLKSQPATLKGKIRFLKVFERTLLSEIESRLSAALAPTRIPRGARGYDDHDDGIGFPSLEGTLMAISFLTFAVYLVRLVMMLFRGAGNSAGTTPIIIGRKKRSVDDFTEETARILSYLDSTLPRQY